MINAFYVFIELYHTFSVDFNTDTPHLTVSLLLSLHTRTVCVFLVLINDFISHYASYHAGVSCSTTSQEYGSVK